MKRLITGVAAAALSLAIASSANAAVFAFSSNPGGLNTTGTDTYSLTVSGITVTVKGFGSLGTSVNLNDQDDVTWSNGNGLGVEGNNDDGINTHQGDGEGLLLDFGQVVNLTQAQFAQWSSGQDDADYRYSSSPFTSGSLTDISSNLTSNGGTATWTTNLTGRYFFFAAVDEGQGDNDKFWLKNVTASAVTTTPPGGGSAVPEPATWAMMIMGFGLAGTQIRRAVREQKRTRSVAL